MLVDQWFGHPGRLGDVVHGGGRVAVLGEEREGDFEQLTTSGIGGEASGGLWPPGWARIARKLSGPGTTPPLMAIMVSGTDAAVVRGAGKDPSDLAGQMAGREVRRGHVEIGVQKRRVRLDQPGVQAVHVGEAEPAEAEGGQFARHRVGTYRQRPPVDGRLDGRVAEALPRRGKGDHVAGPVGVDDADVGQLAGLPPPDRAGSRGHQRIELDVVPVFGRSEQPVGGPEVDRHLDAGPHVLAGDGPSGLQDQPVVVSYTQRLPQGGASSIGRRDLGVRPTGRSVVGIDVEGVVDGGGHDPPVGQLVPAQLVDGHMTPAGIVGYGATGELGALPGKVVVPEDGRTVGQDVGHQITGGRIER